VSAISAVQELTAAEMQARVMSVLESIGAAMPGVGFAIGGVIAAVLSPRATFLVAGLGIFAIVALMVPVIATKWPGYRKSPSSSLLDGGNKIVLELLPGNARRQSDPDRSSEKGRHL
jgi:MFS family permease